MEVYYERIIKHGWKQYRNKGKFGNRMDYVGKVFIFKQRVNIRWRMICYCILGSREDIRQSEYGRAVTVRKILIGGL